MARWWCRTAARICAVPAPRICCNGPTRSGRSSARRGRKAEDEAAQRSSRCASSAISQLPSQKGVSRLSISFVTRMPGPSSSHNNKGTRFGHVRAANSDIPDGECAGVWGRDPRAGAERVVESLERRGQADRLKTRGGKAGSQARRRGRRRRRADADRSVRHLGRLYRDAERQEGLLRAGKAVVVEDQSAESSARSGLCLRLDASGGEGRQRSLDHDRLSAEAGLGIDARSRRRALTRCTRRATASGSRTPPRKSGWWTRCARAPTSTVKGVSAKGTETTDTFSLKGLAQALDRLAQDCKR